MGVPATTRLRYVAAKNPDDLIRFLTTLGMRVEIKGAPVWDGTRWVLWFIPPDDIAKDVKSGKLN